MTWGFLEFQSAETHYQYSGLTAEQLESLEAASSAEQRSEFVYQFQPLDKTKQHPFNVLPKSKGQERTFSSYWKACAAVVLAIIVVQFSYDLLRWVKLKRWQIRLLNRQLSNINIGLVHLVV